MITRLTTGAELWVYREPEGLVLAPPNVVRQTDGRGCPGLVEPAPVVIPAGTVVTLAWAPPRPACLACERAAQLSRGDATVELRDGEVLVHGHGFDA